MTLVSLCVCTSLSQSALATSDFFSQSVKVGLRGAKDHGSDHSLFDSRGGKSG